ncbi:MAG: tRNA (adenosine(37)-N6)-dimethylallyltransferase MiaA [Ignavibacteriales bacterium]|nr:MAG: tRNA (adenosine(37)-N6)-dimethylallyltransferase MiaA [Ignavibacteriales bacterium]
MGKFVLVIVGPTGSGKTSLSLTLSKKINSEIISADSRQFYKYLDIGTAKPSKAEMETVKHHLIDFLNPDEDYNVSKFENDANEIIQSIHQQNKVPVVVGGSGLYIKALVDGIFDTADRDDELRINLKRLKDENGNVFIYEMLKKKDPEAAATMLPQNWKRVIRALEVIELTGKSILHHHSEQSKKSELNFIQIGLNWERETLYKNIESRVDRMISSGLIKETENILSMGYSGNLNSLNTVGYKEIISFLKNEITLDKAIELIKRNTRRYAKRQMTWFKADKRINWYDITSVDEIYSLSEKILSLHRSELENIS